MEFGDLTINGISFGNTEITEVWFGGSQVYPVSGTLTYSLTGLTVAYSDGASYLKPNQSNYAYLTGTWNTFRNGVLINQETVSCTPSLVVENDRTIIDGNYIVWNMDTYGLTEVPAANVNYRGTYNGYLSIDSVNVTAGANSKDLYSSTITALTLGDTATPVFSFTGDDSMNIKASAARTYMYTSGLLSEPETITAYVNQANLDSFVVDIQAQEPRLEAYYEFENNSSTLTNIITVYFTVEAQWTDRQGNPHRTQDVATATHTIGPMEIYMNDEPLVAEPETPWDLPYTIISSMTFMVSGKSVEYEVGSTAQFRDVYNADQFTFTKNVAWAQISNMAVTCDEYTSLNPRTGTIAATDNLYQSATRTLVFTQNGTAT